MIHSHHNDACTEEELGPMHYEYDFETAEQIAKKALDRMQKLNIPQHPHNFEVFYVYFANLVPELKEDLKPVITQNKPMSSEQCSELYEKYIRDKKQEELFNKAGNQIHSTIEGVSGLMTNVRQATSEYTGSLQNVSKNLAATEGNEDVKAMVKMLAQDTAKMMDHNKMLESHLDQSAMIMKELQKDLERVKREAMTDGLTNLSNRKAFDEEIAKAVKQANESGPGFTLLMMDIDHFKSFNDTYGHQIGDQVIKLVARCLTDGVKGRDIASRYGGEEFAIILPESTLKAGIIVGNHLRESIEKKEVVNRSTGQHLGQITISVGVAEYEVGESIESVIERADSALYTAKHNGRNQVAAASPLKEKAAS